MEHDRWEAERKRRMVTRKFYADGMVCASCEKIIIRQASKIPGVKDIKIDYKTQEGEVTYDKEKTSFNIISKAMGEKGYECSLVEYGEGSERSNTKKMDVLDWMFIAAGIILVGYFALNFIDKINVPEISQNMGYGLLFVVGLLTGFHCIAMCGGFVVSYTAKDAKEGRKSHLSHLMYGIGKTVSYTIIGALFGLLGSIIAFTPAIRGIAGVLAGLFLIVFGLNMLNIFPWLRRFQFRTPDFIAKFVGKESHKHSSPLMIGLLNGLMIACGPLQAMYVMAAGTGSMVEGAKLLFIFGLGTLPVMLGFGYLTSLISSKMTHKILKASGVIVIILGAIMLNRGLALAGTGYDVNTILASAPSLGSVNSGDPNSPQSTQQPAVNNNVAVQKDGYQEIRMTIDGRGYTPDTFILKAGVPVKWIIDGNQLTGCNKGILVPKYNLNFQLKQGEQTIEFTPTQAGTIPWSCWMGMIPGTFIVKDDASFNNKAEIQKDLNTAQAPQTAKKAGGCSMGGSSGGCGCGMM